MVIPYYVQNVFLIFGGLGLFLFGMKLLINGLEEFAGNRMRSIVEKTTSNRFFGVIVGAAVTVIIQSSTATSLIAVGFINAGMMSLAQAISLIIGAHIGTTLTAHIFTFGIDTAAPLLIFFGLVMYLFMRRKGIKNVGYLVLSIGILFFGLNIMGEPLRSLAETERFQSMLLAFENPILAVLTGFVFTAIIQSSTAATGILITLYLRGVDLNFTTAAYLVLGISIGTTVTALIASLAGRRESKRLALANLIYITIGSVIFGILIFVFPGILRWFQNTWYDNARQIAMLYTFFKVLLTIMFLPFVGHLAKLMYIIMPKRGTSSDSKELQHITRGKSLTATDAINQSFDELRRMGSLVLENFKLSLEALYNGDNSKAKTVFEMEASINYLNRQIASVLTGARNVESAEDLKKINSLMYIAADLERIGDHAENIAEFNIRNSKNELRLSPQAMEELQTLSSAVVDIIDSTMQLFDTVSDDLLRRIEELEAVIDQMSQQYVENHITRSKNEDIDPRGSVVFVNMLTNLERCGDHAYNIAFYFHEVEQFKAEEVT